MWLNRSGRGRLTLRLVFLALLTVNLTGCRAKPAPSAETKAAYWTKHHLTIGGKHEKNPVAATAENIADGQQAFSSYCMVCHGLDGQNTGVPFASAMAPAVPSLASTEVQAYSDGQLKWIIENGIYPSGMPPSRGIFSDDDMWRMVLYIRHLPKAGSLGEPAVYGGAR
ncbi:MAG: c-type cytochrome [Candidatus Sulfotelmatobacter sp.]